MSVSLSSPPREGQTLARRSRADQVGTVLAGAVAGAGGRWLVAQVDDAAAVTGALGHGAAVVWHRTAYGGRPAAAWPPGGPFDGVALALPRSADELHMTVHALGARLAPGGRLVLAGHNDAGIRPAYDRLTAWFSEVEDLGGRRHCRVYVARGPTDTLRGDLDAWADVITVDVDGTPLAFTSWPGLFAHGQLDEGTALLLRHLPKLGRRVLDLGCGAGVVARVVADRGHEVTASDVDALAVEATRRNVPSATAVVADGLPAGTWDTIVTNPPLHRGPERDLGPLGALLSDAPSRLSPHGVVVLVTRSTLDVPKLAGTGTASRLVSDGRYAVWSVRYPRARLRQ
jgi:16S rRNA (guanine1207-N2)-methyltransferase